MDPEGSLGSSLPEVFATLAGRGEQGLLVVQFEDGNRAFYIEGGAVLPIFEPAQENEPFGDILVFMRAIDLRRVREAMASPEAKAGQPIARVLDRLGYVKADQIEAALHEYLRHRTMDLFLWDGGSYTYHPGSKPAGGDEAILRAPRFDAQELAREGESCRDEWTKLVSSLPPAGEVLRLDLGASDSGVIPHVPESLRLLLDGTLTLEEVLARARFPRLRTVDLLRALHSSRLVRVARADELLRAADKFAGDSFGRDVKFLALYCAKEPDDVAALRKLADAYARVDRDHDAAEVFLQLARKAEEARDLSRAKEHYRHAVDLDPARVEPKEALLDLCLATWDEKGAAGAAVAIIERHLATGAVADAVGVSDRLSGLKLSGEPALRVLRASGQARRAAGDLKGALASYRRAESALGAEADLEQVFDLWQDMVDWPEVPAEIRNRIEDLGLDLPEVPLERVAATGEAAAPGAAPPRRRRWRIVAAGLGVAVLLGGGGVALQESKRSDRLAEARAAVAEAEGLDAAARKSGRPEDARKALAAYQRALALHEDVQAVPCVSSYLGEDERPPVAERISALAAQGRETQAKTRSAIEKPLAEIEGLVAAGQLEEATARIAALRGHLELEKVEPAVVKRIEKAEATLARLRQEEAERALARELDAIEKAAATGDPVELLTRLDASGALLAAPARASGIRAKLVGTIVNRTVGVAETELAAAEAALPRRDMAGARAALDRAEAALAAFPASAADESIEKRIQPTSDRVHAIRADLADRERTAAEMAAQAEELHAEGRATEARALFRRLLDDGALSWTPAARGLALPFDVVTQPAGATVEHAGRDLGRTPLTIRLPASAREWTIRIVRRGFEPVEVGIGTRDAPRIDRSLARAVLWIAPIPARVEAAPSISPDGVFVGARDGYLYRMDAGRDAPRRILGSHRSSGLAEIAARPIVAGSRVVYGTVNDASLYCLAATDLSVLWKRTFDDWFEVDGALDATTGRLYVAVRDGTLHAIAVDTGDELWRASIGPALGALAAGGGGVFSVGPDRKARRTEAADGKLGWSVVLPSAPSDGPLYRDGRLYFGVLDRRVEVLDAGSGERLPAFELPEECRTRPVYGEGAIHALTVSGNWVAFDPSSGRELWRVATSLVNPRSPVVAGKCGYAVGSQGKVVAIDLATGRLEWLYETNEDVDAPPEALAGLLVVAGNKNVHAFEIEE